ncbi:hypothetical protein [Longimycelium tulufanense]|uniref:hypothetical protein n=1 Tax=Longimycelium tulufanense TaxID=907463 RepID=UPI00166B1363|nr:hypothetical protein [Longimycelium tulufanense]
MGELLVAGVLVVGALGSTGQQTYGSSWALFVLSAACVVTGLVLVSVAVVGRVPRAAGWAAALVLAIAAGGVAVVALVSLASASDALAWGVALALLVAAVGMDVLAAQLPRLNPRPVRTRGTP